MQAGTAGVSAPSYEDTSHTGSEPHPSTSFNPNYLPEGIVCKHWATGGEGYEQ